MPVATILHNKFSKKKLMMIAASVGIPLVIAGIIAAFFLIQGVTTSASEEVPSNVISSPLDAEHAQITFQTGKAVLAVVEYGTTPGALTEISIGGLESTDHALQIAGLTPETTYYFRIRAGDSIYDDNGAPWSFKTPVGTASSEEISPIPSIEVGSGTLTPSASPSTTLSGTVVPTPSTPTASASLTPSISITTTPIPTSSASLTPATVTSSCLTTTCTEILSLLGTQCTTQDYIKCIQKTTVSVTAGATSTPTPTPLSSSLKSSCGLSYLQANSCSSFTWNDLSSISKECSDTFTKYFVQCKSNSWSATDPATWFCNELVTSNQLTLPCGSAPAPAAGQSVFCRVRAETAAGGDTNATDWKYTSTSCPRISGDDPNCSIDYVQANSCTSWIWDFDYQKDPHCAPKFDHYFMQCTNDGNFNSSSSWYCNTTVTDHYKDLPCYTAFIPGDGMPITCRIRAEDSDGTDAHASSWATGSSICPTSTPTPTPSPTPTNTPTPTQTPTPTVS